MIGDIHRILDANANRAREALRVMEDAARFLIENAALAADLKTARHDLAAALDTIPGLPLVRDVQHDPGTVIETASEYRRAGAMDVANAAAKRLTEALRTLEEYSKIDAPGSSRAFERLRYRAYEIEQRLMAALYLPDARRWQVCVLLSASLCPGGDWRRVARQLFEAEEPPHCIQLREKGITDAELLDRAAWLVEQAGSVAVVVNDRVDIALAAGAAGVHLGQGDMPVAAARRVVARRLLIGVSTHDLGEAAAAVDAGADYCGVGAMFATPLKPDRTPSGPAYLREFRAAHPDMAHLAIGGITPDNIDELVRAGVRGVAVSRAVCAADDPAAVVAMLSEALQRADAQEPASPYTATHG